MGINLRLCGHTEKSDFTMDDTTTTCFEYFFDRVKHAREVALKYSSAVYKKKNNVALRAKLAALSGQSKEKPKRAAKRKSNISDEEHHKAIAISK